MRLCYIHNLNLKYEQISLSHIHTHTKFGFVQIKLERTRIYSSNKVIPSNQNVFPRSLHT